jgi:thioredoxin-like negative regulator of GroEL
MTTPQAALSALLAVPPGNTSALLKAANEALQHGHAAVAEPILAAAAAAASGSPQLWQYLGLARRELQDSAGAHTAFTRAASMIPDDPLIAHSQARTALEAGYPAVSLFNRARLLAPTDASVALGRAAALFAAGEGEAACDQFAHLLASSPGWSEGHLAYARLSAQVRPEAPIDATLRAALKLHPASGGLWQLVFRVWTEARDYTRAHAAVVQARAVLGRDPELDRLEAICLTELGQAAAAQALFDQLPFPTDAEAATWPIRNYLRLGRYEEARLLAEQDFGGGNDATLWPYRALIWRLLDDPRWHWLEGDERLIQTFDIAADLGPLDQLADVLRSLHAAKAQPLDQSVRGGTQTDGNLLARAEPEIRRLRATLLDAVRSYVDQLPPPDPAHPMLLAQRDNLQVAGSWSVRLTDKGFHADHVHCQGWISSACYIVVPETNPTAAPEAGWLAFGECRDVLPKLSAFRTVEPIPGKLALFPSILWHGTRPFDSGERMTVAFDIARPAQA